MEFSLSLTSMCDVVIVLNFNLFLLQADNSCVFALFHFLFSFDNNAKLQVHSADLLCLSSLDSF